MTGRANRRIVVLDMAGTTVIDDGAVEAAFLTAIDAVGAWSGEADRMLDYVRTTMGQSKIAVFTHLLDGDRQRARRANAAFEQAYATHLDDCLPVPGAAEAIATLRDGGSRVALTTGFSSATQRAIIAALGWHGDVDLLLAPSDSIRGRPHPDLPLAALMQLDGGGVRNLVVVGDTTSDVGSGVRAGAGAVVGVLTGAHDRAALLAAGASHVIESVADLPELVEQEDVRAATTSYPH